MKLNHKAQGTIEYILLFASVMVVLFTFTEHTRNTISGVFSHGSKFAEDGLHIINCPPGLTPCAGKDCGQVWDGCKSVTCLPDTCPVGESCGGAGIPNKCGKCTPTPLATACAGAGKNCGLVDNGCATGNHRCGPDTCPIAGQTCGGGGTLNVCGGCPLLTCQPGDCEAMPGGNGCGGPLTCPKCGLGKKCVNNKCVCDPFFGCQFLGCLDTTPNPCDPTAPPVTCPDNCVSPEVCDSTTHSCCTPTKICRPGVDCDDIPGGDGCGKSLNCGGCLAPNTCGGGGTPNVCGCTPQTCHGQCQIPGGDDGCGGGLVCKCAPWQSCQNNMCKCDPNYACRFQGCGTAINSCDPTAPPVTCPDTCAPLGQKCNGTSCCTPTCPSGKCGTSESDGCDGTKDCSSNCSVGESCDTSTNKCIACTCNWTFMSTLGCGTNSCGFAPALDCNQNEGCEVNQCTDASCPGHNTFRCNSTLTECKNCEGGSGTCDPGETAGVCKDCDPVNGGCCYNFPWGGGDNCGECDFGQYAKSYLCKNDCNCPTPRLGGTDCSSPNDGLWFGPCTDKPKCSDKDGICSEYGPSLGICGPAPPGNCKPLNETCGGSPDCSPCCGDTFVDPLNKQGIKEVCDKTTLPIPQCSGLPGKGYELGNTACDSSCQYDESACQKCGDGKITSPEVCDPNGPIFAPTIKRDCTDFTAPNGLKYTGGLLGCKSGTFASGGCDYDFSQCYWCGDGKSQGSGEQCDPGPLPDPADDDLRGYGCINFRDWSGKFFTSGTLSCKSDCSDFDTSLCTRCGNWIIETGESCDDGNFLDGDTCNKNCSCKCNGSYSPPEVHQCGSDCPGGPPCPNSQTCWIRKCDPPGCWDLSGLCWSDCYCENCGPPSSGGDGICSYIGCSLPWKETSETCPQDCLCNGNGTCDAAAGENCAQCPLECPCPPTNPPTGGSWVIAPGGGSCNFQGTVYSPSTCDAAQKMCVGNIPSPNSLICSDNCGGHGCVTCPSGQGFPPGTLCCNDPGPVVFPYRPPHCCGDGVCNFGYETRASCPADNCP